MSLKNVYVTGLSSPGTAIGSDSIHEPSNHLGNFLVLKKCNSTMVHGTMVHWYMVQWYTGAWHNGTLVHGTMVHWYTFQRLLSLYSASA